MMGQMQRLGLMVIVFIFGFSTWVNAEELNLPDPAVEQPPTPATAVAPENTDQATQAASTEPTVAMPSKGISKIKVDETYGQPQKTIAAIGEPPIERWVYDQFTVYFENQTVIHSVVHNQNKQETP